MNRRNFIKAAAATAVAPVHRPFVRLRPARPRATPSSSAASASAARARPTCRSSSTAASRPGPGSRPSATPTRTGSRTPSGWPRRSTPSRPARTRPRRVAAYRDFRELLARQDLDGVLIVTPDFWHAAHAVAAAEAGKDIYLEKPLTYSIAEGTSSVAAVRKNKRILQVGSQQRSSIHFLMACELVRNGRVGKLQHDPRLAARGPGQPATARPTPVPPNLDYDAWMGPTAAGPLRRGPRPSPDELRAARLAPDRALLPGHDHRLGLAHDGHRPVGPRHGPDRARRASRPRPSSPTAACSTSTPSSRPKRSTPTASG
ncbi:MAG: Gfo/Idh/MocA family oxidoreductase [Candidatus Moduliflexus flocculans]|nr:Gfo/Idh/MocA family oxidoreductase [Candidatus Moduliflexus flocculans]